MGQNLTPLEMLRNLVAFDTVSANPNEMMIRYIVDYLEGHGIPSNVKQGEEPGKLDLIATIGPNIEGGLVLSGHTDVVPVEGQDWFCEPFDMTEKDGKLYGRGTCDMKGFLAVVLALVPEMLQAKLVRPLHFVFSYDEEVGCLGAPGLISRLIKEVPMPLAAIVGEPTSMRLVNAHKGVSIFETRVVGKPAHSSQTQLGVNAITAAADCITFLRSMAEKFKKQEKLDDRMEPPYNTINIGMIDGGTALNIVAGECKFTWGFRSIGKKDATSLINDFERYCNQQVLPAMRAVASGSDIFTKRLAVIPPLLPVEDNPAEELVRVITGQNKADGVAVAAEAGMFQESGIPAVICGPGSIEQAHKPNEFVEVNQIKVCIDFIRNIIKWATTKSAA
ncbi:MAG: acetylornithine deacetylase [Pseudomonadota bacterium]|nr:acetylornithine deacetylase [Pseudomonadota bacterium]